MDTQTLVHFALIQTNGSACVIQKQNYTTKVKTGVKIEKDENRSKEREELPRKKNYFFQKLGR